MATSRFDTISKLFARRKAVAVGVIAQEATPAATTDGEKIPYLFVQSFEGGSIAPKAAQDGTYTMTLEHGLGQTLYFADRPSRDVGAVPTSPIPPGPGLPRRQPAQRRAGGGRREWRDRHRRGRAVQPVDRPDGAGA